MSRETTTTMPTPMLKVLNISRSGMRPVSCSRRKMGGVRMAAFSIFAVSPTGRHRGMFSKNPPPVMWLTPRTSAAPMAASTGLT